MQVDTSIPGHPSVEDVWLSVSVLMSYQRMGTAQFVRPALHSVIRSLQSSPPVYSRLLHRHCANSAVSCSRLFCKLCLDL